MTPEDASKREQEVFRGQQAKQVVDNPIYKEAFILIKAQLLSGFEATGADQDEERREIWRTIKNLNKLEDQIKFVMETGEMAKKSLMKKVFNQ